MQLSTPIYRLKRQAKLLSREKSIPLHKALDQIAAQEGFTSWSLLAATASAVTPAAKLFAQLSPGDMVLLGARPGQGKTLLGLELAVEAMKLGQRGVFFTLEYTEDDVLACFRTLGIERPRFGPLFECESSDDINANYITKKLVGAPSGTLAVIDYLQLLDQKRQNPELMVQVRQLASLAHEQGFIFVFLSQIARSYNPSAKPFPTLEDVRLPNALDLNLFTKTCFLNNGAVRFGPTHPAPTKSVILKSVK